MFDRIKYFNYVYFSGRININYIPEKSILFALVKVLGKSIFFTFQIIKALFSYKKIISSNSKIVFFVMSSNNFASINPIFQKLPVGTANMFGDKALNKSVSLFMPIVASSYIAILFFPKLFYDYITSDVINKKRFKQGINDIVLSYPFYYVSFFWFKIVKPMAIVISNDHVYSTRILIHWANIFKVPSFYVQHASVTADFPPLEMSWAFLEGEDAKEKYIKAGSDPSKIELIGIPKLDELYKKINHNTIINTIGIASNGLEPEQSVLGLINFLHANYPHIGLIYRPHRLQYTSIKYKADLTATLENIPQSVIVSDPFKEKVTDFLPKIDCLIAGESGIHLEAVLLNVTSIYFFHETEYFDDYGFVKNKLVDIAHNMDELKSMIDGVKSNRPPTRYRAKRYCHTVDSDFDGHATDLAIILLKEKISSKI